MRKKMNDMKGLKKRQRRETKFNRKTSGERLTGILEKNRSGFGFVRQEEGRDIFIRRSNMNGAMHGDLVEVDLLPEYLWERNKEGIIE